MMILYSGLLFGGHPVKCIVSAYELLLDGILSVLVSVKSQWDDTN